MPLSWGRDKLQGLLCRREVFLGGGGGRGVCLSSWGGHEPFPSLIKKALYLEKGSFTPSGLCLRGEGGVTITPGEERFILDLSSGVYRYSDQKRRRTRLKEDNNLLL